MGGLPSGLIQLFYASSNVGELIMMSSFAYFLCSSCVIYVNKKMMMHAKERKERRGDKQMHVNTNDEKG